MKKGFIACMMLVLGLVFLIGTSEAALISFQKLPSEVLPGAPITFEVWLDKLEEALSDIACFGLYIGAPPGVTWNTSYITTTTKANPDYVFYGTTSYFDATILGSNVLITDVGIPPTLTTEVPVKLASLKLDQNFPYCTLLTFSVLDSDWSYALDSSLVQDNFKPITGEVHVTPIPGTLLLLGSGLIGLLGVARRRIRR